MMSVQDLIKQVDFDRRTLDAHKKAEDQHIDNLKRLALYQQYLAEKQCRLDMAKKVKSGEAKLRDALIDSGEIDGDNRHPAVHSVTRKEFYDYDTRAAVQYAIENGLVHCLGIDKSKFDSFLSHLAESDAPLPEFAEACETVSVSLKSDLSDVLGGDA